MWIQSKWAMAALLIFSWLPLAAATEMPTRASAFRFPDESALQAQARTRTVPDDPSALTALTEAVSVETLNRKIIPEWARNAPQDAFLKIRDHETLRHAWEFAYDGCFARAAVASQVMEASGFRRPAKLFIFGELSLETESAGTLTWWYHVAPVVAHGDQIYLLDPAVDRNKPLPLREWISRLTHDPSSVTVSVCNPFSYDPWSPCYISGPDVEARAQADLAAYAGVSSP